MKIHSSHFYGPVQKRRIFFLFQERHLKKEMMQSHLQLESTSVRPSVAQCFHSLNEKKDDDLEPRVY